MYCVCISFHLEDAAPLSQPPITILIPGSFMVASGLSGIGQVSQSVPRFVCVCVHLLGPVLTRSSCWCVCMSLPIYLSISLVVLARLYLSLSPCWCMSPSFISISTVGECVSLFLYPSVDASPSLCLILIASRCCCLYNYVCRSVCCVYRLLCTIRFMLVSQHKHIRCGAYLSVNT